MAQLVAIHVAEAKANGLSFKLTVDLNTNASELRNQVADLAKINIGQLKLLCAGKFLKDGVNLASQGIKEGSKILIMKTASNNEQQQTQKNRRKYTKS